METLLNNEVLEKNPTSFYKIRFQDCDPLGHLNNGRYLDYLLNAREDHLEEFYKLDPKYFMSKGVAWVVSNHDIHYLRSAVLNQRVCIRTSLIHYTDQELYIEAAMYDETQKTLMTLMWSRLVCVDVRSGKKSQHNEELTALFSSLHNTEVPFEEGIRKRLAMLKPQVV